MGGMLTVEEVEAFSREEQAAARSMGAASGGFVLLVETIGNQVQTQEVMAAFGRLLQSSPLKAGKIATVRAGALTRMQSKRVMQQRSGTAVFDNVADARSWLLGTSTASEQQAA